MIALTKLATATKRLNRLTDDLEAMADWRDDLQSRISRAHLRFEFCGFDREEQEQLEAEARTFLNVCRCITDGFDTRCVETERRVA